MNRKKLSIVIIVALLALGALFTSAVLARSSATPSGAPTVMNYQGYLLESGTPISGTVDMTFGLYAASSGGTALWEETHSAMQVSGGYYSVILGNSTPLSAADFSDTTRYMQVSVDSGSGSVDLPRQQIASVPYALQAAEADHASTADSATAADSATTASSADSAPWSGLTGVPAGFADGVDDVGGANYANRITVAKSGGDYTSVADALDSISDAAADNPYLVWVGPGVFTDTNLVSVPSYVHLQGSGPGATIISSARSSGTPSNNSATVDLLDYSRISNLSVINEGTSTFGIAIYSAETGRGTKVDNVVAEATGSHAGGGNYAVYLNDSEATISGSVLRASGATGFGTAVNAALGVVNIAGGYPRPLIEESMLIGGGNNDPYGLGCSDPTGTGFGIQGSSAAPTVVNSYICGGHRGIAAYVAGQMHIHHSEVWASSTGSAYLFESTASGTIIITHSGVFYVGNKYTGTGNLACTYNHLANYVPASDGQTPASACN